MVLMAKGSGPRFGHNQSKNLQWREIVNELKKFIIDKLKQWGKLPK